MTTTVQCLQAQIGVFCWSSSSEYNQITDYGCGNKGKNESLEKVLKNFWVQLQNESNTSDFGCMEMSMRFVGSINKGITALVQNSNFLLGATRQKKIRTCRSGQHRMKLVLSR